jgi:hypothetical protein
MLFYTGLNEEQLMEAGTELKKSYVKSKDGNKLWFKNFLKYQKKLPLNSANNSHKQIISLILENLSDETKFKGSEILKSLLPNDLQIGKSPRKKKEVSEKIETTETFEPNPQDSKTQAEQPQQESSTKNSKFIKPSSRDVYEYMANNEFEFAQTESVRFVNFYESNGWRIGKNPMKRWKSAVANWMINYYERNKISTPKLSKLQAIQQAHQSTESVDWNEIYKDNRNEQFN